MAGGAELRNRSPQRPGLEDTLLRTLPQPPRPKALRGLGKTRDSRNNILCVIREGVKPFWPPRDLWARKDRVS